MKLVTLIISLTFVLVSCSDKTGKDLIHDSNSSLSFFKSNGESYIELYHDDGRCNPDKLIAYVEPHTNCDSLSGLDSVWGIRINGVCKDISDSDAPNVCRQYKVKIPPRGPHIALFHDDGRCNTDKLIAYVEPHTNCNSLTGLDSVWGVRINGVCQDISDSDAPQVCRQYKVKIPPRGPHIALFHDDGRCNSDKLIGFVARNTNCNSLSGLDSVWGIRINGVCKDISDSDAPNVCRQYKVKIPPRGPYVELYHDDGRCNSDKLIGFVSRRTNCNSLKGLDSVWGIRINGVCKDISDSDAPNVCRQYKVKIPPPGPHIELYHDDGRCNSDKLIGFVGRNTNCDSLSGLDSVWGIRINGACKDISDSDAPNVCREFKHKIPPN